MSIYLVVVQSLMDNWWSISTILLAGLAGYTARKSRK
jgi:hypothetical protein